MKLAALALLALTLTACTTFYRDGKPIARFAAVDMENVVYEDGPTKFSASKVDHSTATKAALQTVNTGIMSATAVSMLKP